MKTLTLHRFAANPRQTIGRLYTEQDQSWLTIERSKTDVNHPCIPAGTYPLALDTYHKGGYPAYEVRHVPGRSRILIHAANVASELEGCIGPGHTLEIIGGEIGVTSSRGSLAELMAAMAGEIEGQLVITEEF